MQNIFLRVHICPTIFQNIDTTAKQGPPRSPNSERTCSNGAAFSGKWLVLLSMRKPSREWHSTELMQLFAYRMWIVVKTRNNAVEKLAGICNCSQKWRNGVYNVIKFCKVFQILGIIIEYFKMRDFKRYFDASKWQGSTWECGK